MKFDFKVIPATDEATIEMLACDVIKGTNMVLYYMMSDNNSPAERSSVIPSIHLNDDRTINTVSYFNRDPFNELYVSYKGDYTEITVWLSRKGQLIIKPVNGQIAVAFTFRLDDTGRAFEHKWVSVYYDDFGMSANDVENISKYCEVD